VKRGEPEGIAHLACNEISKTNETKESKPDKEGKLRVALEESNRAGQIVSYATTSARAHQTSCSRYERNRPQNCEVTGNKRGIDGREMQVSDTVKEESEMNEE